MHPVGPLDPKVYWIRRVMVIVIAVAVVIGLAWFVVSRARGSAAASGSDQSQVAGLVSTSPALTGVLATETSQSAATSEATTSSAATTAPTTTPPKSTTATPKTTKAAPKTTKAAPTSTATKTTKAAPSTTKAPKTTKAAPTTTPKPAPTTTAPKTTAPKTTLPKTTAPKTTPKPTTTSPKPSPKPTPKPTPTAPTTDAQGRLLCTAAATELTTTVGSPTYAVGQMPILGVHVKNVGNAPCVRDVSGTLQVFTAYDANGTRIWSTADCVPGEGTDVRYLQVGEGLQYNIKWSGTTSQPGCAGDRLQVPAGTYTIVATVGGQKASPATLTFS